MAITNLTDYTDMPDIKFWNNFTADSNYSFEATTVCLNEYCVSHEDYIDMIADYIRPTVFEYCLIVTYAIVFIVGIVGNFLVGFAVWRNHSMRTVTNYFIVNLAVADFLVILICMPPTLLVDVTETWFMGRVICKIVKYFQSCSVCVSVLTLTSISIERWYAICHPLKFKATQTRAKYIISITWAMSLIIPLPDLITMEIHRHKNIPTTMSILLTSCAPSWSDVYQAMYQFFLLLIMYLLPFCLMFTTYSQIARSLWRTSIPSESSRDQLAPECRPNTEAVLNTRRKVAKMLIAVVVMFGICYLPVHLLNILKYTGIIDRMPPDLISYIALGSHFLCYFNSAINPVIYSFMSAKFRKEFQIACCCGLNSRDAKRNAHSRQYIYKYRVQSQSGASDAPVSRNGVCNSALRHVQSPAAEIQRPDIAYATRPAQRSARNNIFSVENDCRAALRLESRIPCLQLSDNVEHSSSSLSEHSQSSKGMLCRSMQSYT